MTTILLKNKNSKKINVEIFYFTNIFLNELKFYQYMNSKDFSNN